MRRWLTRTMLGGVAAFLLVPLLGSGVSQASVRTIRPKLVWTVRVQVSRAALKSYAACVYYSGTCSINEIYEFGVYDYAGTGSNSCDIRVEFGNYDDVAYAKTWNLSSLNGFPSDCNTDGSATVYGYYNGGSGDNHVVTPNKPLTGNQVLYLNKSTGAQTYASPVWNYQVPSTAWSQSSGPLGDPVIGAALQVCIPYYLGVNCYEGNITAPL